MHGIHRHNQKGMTLFELVCALAVVAIIAVLASRGASAAIYASRTGSGLASLMAALTRARSVAASTEVDVVLCPSADGETCHSGYHWEGGWIAFQATKPGSNRVAGEPLVLSQPAFPPRVHLITSAGRTRIRFQGNGGNAGSNATFTLCDGRGARSASAYAMANNGNLHATPADSGNVALACAGL
jgi:type IV fimbrial biogenesis protein FimT